MAGPEGGALGADSLLSPPLTGLPDSPHSRSRARRSEDVGILKAQSPGTVKCVMLCSIHLKDRVGRYSLRSEGHQTR